VPGRHRPGRQPLRRPDSGLVVDLEESPEPNGVAIATGVEFSAAPAGVINLKPAGEAFVIHGHITPFRDFDGDGQLDPTSIPTWSR